MIKLIPYLTDDGSIAILSLWNGQYCEFDKLIFRYSSGQIHIIAQPGKSFQKMFLYSFRIGGRPRKKASHIIRWLQERNYRQIYMGQLRRMLEKAQRGLLQDGFEDNDIVVRVCN